jgi:hypothetical protein
MESKRVSRIIDLSSASPRYLSRATRSLYCLDKRYGGIYAHISPNEGFFESIQGLLIEGTPSHDGAAQFSQQAFPCFS